MAGRGHVDVNERRLRPIYDNLDNGNNKVAIQLVDKVLKKQKDLHCAKVLKALALFRMGKSNESFTLIQEVASLEPSDDPTLQAMSICYREMQKPELITKIYESAVRKQPSNEEYHSHLFMAYVRMGDYKKQHQAAMTLYKQFPKNPYYFWAVMSKVMEAMFSSDDTLSKKIILPLTLKMVEKLAKEDKLEAEAEVQLYLMVLDLMDKHEEAITLLQGELGEKIVSEWNYHKYRIACLYAKMEKWAEANAAYRKLLREQPDQWSFYLSYFKSAFELIDSGWTPQEDQIFVDGPPDYTVDSIIHFVEDVIQLESAKDSRPQRGPYLARMELFKRLKERKNKDIEKLGSLTAMLLHYFDVFGDKYCCFGDLSTFLADLDKETIQSFLDSLWKRLELDPVDGKITFAENEKHLQRHVSFLQISRFLGKHESLSSDEKISLSKELLKRYHDGLKFGADLLSTDLLPSDMYCLFAAHLLLDVWKQAGDDGMLWRVIPILEKGRSNSPANHHFKLLLIRLYCIVGAFGPCLQLYEEMEIKHVQRDTIGYIVTRHCAPLGHFHLVSGVYNDTLKFFTVNHKDTTEYIISAYKYGSFPKIPEFVKFRQKLNNSLHYTTITVEKMISELLLEANANNLKFEDLIRYMEINPEKDEIVWDELSDNRDFTLLVSYDSEEKQCSEEDKKDSTEQEKGWLKLQSLVLRILTAAGLLLPTVNTNINKNGTETPDMGEILKTLVNEFETHLEQLEKNPVTHKKFPLQGPPESRTSDFLNGNHGNIILNMMKATSDIQHLHANGIDNSGEVQERIKNYLQQTLRLLEDTLSKNRQSLVTEKDGQKKLHYSVLPNMVLLTESIGYITLLSGVCCKLLKPIKSIINKRNRKKKEAPQAMPAIFETYKKFLDSIQQFADTVHIAVLDLDPVFVSMDLSQLSLVDKETAKCVTNRANMSDRELESSMWKKIEESYKQSSQNLSGILKQKMEYLATLKL
ncbi:N-alpha-acetyltransferase 25, NatB auxiliary subunit-like [Saccoglossus kowalevskii]|uniref:N-alpha-acetyltransferase 25, NatB auxiliary subunit-like n=1 Tax=Saccoglossus kowalevskii TaxID=10224 RepID=A0ABM0MNP6_SACKO|nr:PREDICTED: N-alpha-acetyltransferase 25, NatB auxiliary subunit-like [Saccoglossus kowalevskii]